MLKRYLALGAVVAVALIALVGYSVLRTPAAASAPIEAIPLEVETQEPPTEAVSATTETTEAQDTAAPVATATEAQATDSLLVFEISPADSEVRFELDEDLRGVRTTVVGTTDQVAGQIAFDPADLASAQVGIIQINARTLATDNDFRNRAIQNQILDTGDYEYITFTPESIQGLEGSTGVGETVTFTILGDLTIRDVTQEVTFSVEATRVSEIQLAGTARATVSRGDYSLAIPSVPQVANVEEEIELILEFLAAAA